MRYAVIMAGGAGTRLWPLSRKDRPKQLIRFIRRPGDDQPRALLELAASRVDGLVPVDRRFVVTAEGYRKVIRELLPEFEDDQILGEPVARDTVNAVGLAAAVLEKQDKDAIFAVLTADHVIEPAEVFRERMDLAFKLVESDPRRFVTFSIKPTYAATGFGYIERGAPVRDRKEGKREAIDGGASGAYFVERFVEKPDLHRAQVYVQSGDFAWNSGMFVWKASTFLEALKAFKPESHEGLMKIQAALGTKKARAVLEEVYPTLPKISVDYAVLEPAAKEALAHHSGHKSATDKGGKDRALPRFPIVTVQTDVRWLDVGSWPSFAETVEADAAGNRVSGAGSSVVVSAKNNLVVCENPGHTVAILGCEDLVVVHTPDATLVMPRAKSEELKALHGAIHEKLK
jgi:mannose-1-phosphate guanylyltransferase